MLRQTTEVELNMNSVERVLEYTDLPLELDTTKPAARCGAVAGKQKLTHGRGCHTPMCMLRRGVTVATRAGRCCIPRLSKGY